jgi:hypothetical protein
MSEQAWTAEWIVRSEVREYRLENGRTLGPLVLLLDLRLLLGRKVVLDVEELEKARLDEKTK